MQKNVAGQKWIVFAFDRTNNTPKTGDAANITANINKDFAGAAATNDVNPTELEDGFYAFDMTQGESNGNHLLLAPESSTSNIQVIGVPASVYTTPPNFSAMGIESDGDLTKVNTLNGHTAQTGDSYARLGAPAGASVSADVAAVKTETALIVVDTNELQTDWTNGGRLDLIIDLILADTGELQTNQGNWLTATGFSIHSAADVWAVATRVLTAGTNLNDLSAAQVNTECDTALSDYGALKGGAVMTESYAADGATATPEQMLYMIWAVVSEFAISGTTITAKKLDNSTTAMTFTLDDGTDPTSRTRAT